MKYLLDTHVWIWSVLGHPALGPAARKALKDAPASEPVGLAAISLKEAAWHAARGRIELRSPAASWDGWLREAAQAPGLEVLPLTVEVAIESELLPAAYPADPADRLIAATARLHRLTLITADERLRAAPGLRTLW